MASFEEKFRESIESALSELNLEGFGEDSNEPNESYSKYKITDEDNLNKRILTIQKDQDKANEENRKITASQTQIQKAQKNILNIITTVIVVIAITIIGWFYEGVYRSRTRGEDNNNRIRILEIELNKSKSDINDMKKENELQIEKRYNELLKIQLNKK